MSQGIFNICKEFQFDAAHQLDAGPGGDPKYRRLHGHSYQLEVWMRGPRNQYGWLIDIGDLERRIALVRDQLDHRFLNDVEGLEVPTMENIALFVWRDLADMELLWKVAVKRTQNGEACEFYGEGLD